jgi:hypothetical protein
LKTSVCVKECPLDAKTTIECPVRTSDDGVEAFCTKDGKGTATPTYKTYKLVRYCIPSGGKADKLKAIWDDMLVTL